MSNLTVPAATDPATPVEPHVPRFREAYQRLEDEIRAVPADTLLPHNVDIPQAVTTALGALPELRTFRERIVRELPAMDITSFDKLEAYALAAGHAHSMWVAASEPTQSLTALADEALRFRELLSSDVRALSKRGLLDGSRLKVLKGPRGYRNLAFDVFTLANMLRQSWPRVAGKTAVDLTELEQAETVADRLVTAVGEREQGTPVIGAAAEMRQRAYTLFLRAYGEARRAVNHLRWHEEDVDTIVPSLYAGRGGRGARRASEAAAPAASTPAVAMASKVVSVGSQVEDTQLSL